MPVAYMIKKSASLQLEGNKGKYILKGVGD